VISVLSIVEMSNHFLHAVSSTTVRTYTMPLRSLSTWDSRTW
jgi:hypothetical protein